MIDKFNAENKIPVDVFSWWLSYRRGMFSLTIGFIWATQLIQRKRIAESVSHSSSMLWVLRSVLKLTGNPLTYHGYLYLHIALAQITLTVQAKQSNLCHVLYIRRTYAIQAECLLSSITHRTPTVVKPNGHRAAPNDSNRRISAGQNFGLRLPPQAPT